MFTVRNIIAGVFCFMAAVLFTTACWSDLEEINDELEKKVAYHIRDIGPAGGLIFHVVDNGDGTNTYYEAWSEDESGTYQWKNDLTSTNGTAFTVGTGYNNTYNCMTGSVHPAAEAVRNATHGGKNDWFLPSTDELGLMRSNLYLFGVGGFTPVEYWSSTAAPGDPRNAYFHNFSNTSWNGDTKDTSKKVRAARSFVE